MATRRQNLGSAVLHGAMYAAGGYDGLSQLSSVEKYNPFTNEWTAVSDMNTSRLFVALAVAGARLYAVGGYDGNTILDTVEVFEPELNQWMYHSCMNDRLMAIHDSAFI
ncbi:kelch repeat protein [Ostertagia ostertagi]